MITPSALMLKPRIGLALMLAVALVLTGCGGARNWPEPTPTPAPAARPAPPPPATGPTYWRTHTVKAGETLKIIAARYGVSWEELARSNRIENPNLIHVGQRIRIPTREPPAALQGSDGPASGVAWRWPVQGALLTLFEGENGSKGIDIGGTVGTKIAAAGDGRVAYAGSGLKGYGELIIIKHNNNFLSAYAYNRMLYVKEGDLVQAGQTIAEMGEGPDRRASLHFEIRQNGQPVDPLRYLPAR
ncbi:MAG TPA: peptidoglycan DD-metalloendopeptidase family protein [Candidatus Macondimonas sp.]|nr:peptidoglycan DD-metalloendopeptidase family protein [Candidatus Macondimonas sp.]